ncbi:MAG: hypothetical protein ABSE48_22170 [Verrucomicrobiota bacterium]|jgi:hypothetical protein
MIIYGGIDNGVSGGIVARFANGEWAAHPVAVTQYNGRRVLDIHGNLAILDSLAKRAGGRDRLFVVYEQSRKNTKWGTKNSFANGQNHEFWRVLLTLEGFRFSSVDPLTWQAACSRDLPGADSKERALNFVRMHCPDLEWLEEFNVAKRKAIVDAMCVALWSISLKLGEETALTGPLPGHGVGVQRH